MNRKIHCLLLAFALAGAVEASAALGFRGWYEIGATVIDDAELESFLGEPVSDNKVKFEPGFRGSMAIGADLTRYVAIEAEGGFHYNSLRSISGATSDEAELYQFPVLGNLVLKFPNRTRWTPVVGGGVGAIFSLLDADDIALGASRFSSTEETWSFAWQGYAGLTYSFRPDMALGLTYHYLHSDNPGFDGDGGDVKFDRLVNHSLALTFSFQF